MDLTRQEYPAMLDSLEPSQAVALLNDRIMTVGKINNEIADWLEERRRVEELYAQGLRKLARKQPPNGASDLGVFSSPWKTIVSSCESLAESHFMLAQKIDADVERPLRQYTSSSREMQSMPNIQGNLAALAKDIDGAQRKADKGRGGRDAGKVENAQSQWDSQAPFVFEQLQAADEGRCNHLRNVLTQYQTHEVDLVERNRVTAEQCLNALLNIETADEIKTFSLKNTGGGGASGSGRARPERPERTSSRVLPSAALASPSVSSPVPDDRASQRSGSVHEEEKKKGGLRGLKRLGTVLSRRRQSTQPPTGSPSTPARNAGSSKYRSPSPGFLPPQTINEADTIYESPSGPPPSRISRGLSNGPSESGQAPQLSPSLVNGSSFGGYGQLQEPLQPGPAATAVTPENPFGSSDSAPTSVFGRSSGNNFTNNIGSSDNFGSTTVGPSNPPGSSGNFGSNSTYGSSSNFDPSNPFGPSSNFKPSSTSGNQTTTRDSDGFTVPPPKLDPISQAQADAEAESLADGSASQLKLDIRNAPIAEEGPEAQTAMANMASKLREQAATGYRGGTVRGRRDVRNTIFVPSPTTADATTEQQPFMPPLPPLPTCAPAFTPQTTGTSSPPILMTPFLQAMHANLPVQRPSISDAHADSDTRSIRSGTSTMAMGPTIRHPELIKQGLNSSIIETVSAWLDHGSVTRAVLIGELALAYNAGPFPSSSSAESIRLENFAALEKVAPNPALISQVSGKPGEYTVDLSGITRTAVAFKYQVHMDDSTFAAQAPIILTPTWKVEANQTSVILSYSLNPAFATNQPLTLSNVGLAISLDTSSGVGRPSTCLSKPVGTFSKERATIFWRLNDVTLRPGAPAEKVLARFQTEGQAVPGKVEAKWEVVGNGAEGLGSGLSVSRADEGVVGDSADPFADEEVGGGGEGRAWRPVGGVRKLVSGTYVAV